MSTSLHGEDQHNMLRFLQTKSVQYGHTYFKFLLRSLPLKIILESISNYQIFNKFIAARTFLHPPELQKQTLKALFSFFSLASVVAEMPLKEENEIPQ